ncbi:MAG: S-adenosylmethionine decarboxylase [Nanoarchaeota archaeon]|nr:S-adenosylmethionine decarboxylase [Nanoarchaeota archaeon]
MINLEPKITRKRLIVEGRYTIKIDEEIIKNFLIKLTENLKMKKIIEPIIFTPNELKHPIHHGIAGFIGWAESGGSVYTWDKFNFFTVDIYTCKGFSVEDAIEFIKDYFKTSELEYQEI